MLLFTLGINSGLRISDILALDVQDVKDKKFIQITEKRQANSKIPINSKLRPMIFEFTKNKSPNSPLFETVFKNRLDRFAAYEIIKTACKKAGIEGKIGTHTLRKTFGYHHYKSLKMLRYCKKFSTIQALQSL